MKITRAIPKRLMKDVLTDDERNELKSYGDRHMTVDEIEAREIEEEQSAKTVEAAKKEAAKNEIKAALDEIDRKSIRAIRSGETEKLKDLEKEAVQLRKSLNA